MFSKGNQNVIETEDGKKVINEKKNNFIHRTDTRGYSHCTTKVDVFAEWFNRTIRKLSEKPVWVFSVSLPPPADHSPPVEAVFIH